MSLKTTKYNEMHINVWCPQCGPDMAIDEDGCCFVCGSDAHGEGADLAKMNADALESAEVLLLREAKIAEEALREAETESKRAEKLELQLAELRADRSRAWVKCQEHQTRADYAQADAKLLVEGISAGAHHLEMAACAEHPPDCGWRDFAKMEAEDLYALLNSTERGRR